MIFSWLSWLAVFLAGTHDDDGDDGGVVQHGGHAPSNRLTETCGLGLPRAFLANDIN